MTIPEPKPDSPTWPLVLRFAKLMEAKLEKNRHKGDHHSWRKESTNDLWERVCEELGELDSAILKQSLQGVAYEAADVANFLMMIADKAIENENSRPPESVS